MSAGGPEGSTAGRLRADLSASSLGPVGPTALRGPQGQHGSPCSAWTGLLLSPPAVPPLQPRPEQAEGPVVPDPRPGGTAANHHRSSCSGWQPSPISLWVQADPTPLRETGAEDEEMGEPRAQRNRPASSSCSAKGCPSRAGEGVVRRDGVEHPADQEGPRPLSPASSRPRMLGLESPPSITVFGYFPVIYTHYMQFGRELHTLASRTPHRTETPVTLERLAPFPRLRIFLTVSAPQSLQVVLLSTTGWGPIQASACLLRCLHRPTAAFAGTKRTADGRRASTSPSATGGGSRPPSTSCLAHATTGPSLHPLDSQHRYSPKNDLPLMRGRPVWQSGSVTERPRLNPRWGRAPRCSHRACTLLQQAFKSSTRST